MDRQEAKDLIVKLVTDVKATELAANPAVVGIDNFIDILQEVIAEGNLIEIEYSLPSMPYRVKSFLLPKRTKVKLCESMIL